MAHAPAKKPALSKKTSKKQVATPKKASTAVKNARARKLKSPHYKSFRISRRIESPKPQVTGSFRLFWQSLKLLKRQWRIFAGIVVIYLVLTIVLVKGSGSNLDVQSVKDSLLSLFHGHTAQIGASLAIFGLLIGSANSPNSDVGGAYQSILLVVVSLVLIWALRQVVSGAKVTVHDAYYKGLTPLIPFLLVLIIISLQLLPLAAANFLYSAVFAGGIAVSVLEKALWGLLLALCALWSLYMITSSIFALYIVTLPDLRPMQALRSARGLVRYRRWTVMRRVVFLPVALIVVGAIIMLPVIIWLPFIAEWLFFVLTMCSLAVLHAYMYSLYRELL